MNEISSSFDVGIQAALDAPGLTLPPETFPTVRYKPVEIIGSGAAGVVYKCVDLTLKKIVAVKCLHTITGEQLIAFQTEAKSTSQLQHPSIVAVMDFGVTECGAPYMVMEFAPGVSLKEWVERNRQPMPPEMAMNIFLMVSNALNYAHEKGIFHRDVTSVNILIDDRSPEIEARIIDFGVATLGPQDQEPTVTKQGVTLVGTPAYMSPDQANGLKFDARSEIYSLGCVMFETLTGRTPFEAASPLELVSLHAHTPAPLLSEARPDLQFPDSLTRIVEKCLQKDPNKRFQNMKDFAAALAMPISQFEAAPRYETDTNVPEQSSVKTTSKLFLIGTSIAAVSSIVILGILCTDLLKPEAMDKIKLNRTALAGTDKQEDRKESLRLSAIALRELEAGNLEDAKTNCLQASRKWELNVEALRVRALTELLMGNVETARSTIHAALSIEAEKLDGDPVHSGNAPSLHFYRGVILVANLRWLDAQEEFSTARSEDYKPTKWDKEKLGKYMELWYNPSASAPVGEQQAQFVPGVETRLAFGDDAAIAKYIKGKEFPGRLNLHRGLFTADGIKQMKGVVDLGIIRTPVTQDHLRALATLPKLKWLWFVGCPGFNGSGLEAFDSCPKINTLGFVEMQGFDDESLKSLRNNKHMISLSITNCNVFGDGFKYFKRPIDIVDWGLSSHPYSTLVPLAQGLSPGLLQLNSDQLYTEHYDQLKLFKRTKSFRLTGLNKIPKLKLKKLLELPMATEFHFNGPNVKGSTLRVLDGKAKLLLLSGNKLTDDDIAEIAKMKEVEMLYIQRQDTLTQKSLTYLSHMAGLKYLEFLDTPEIEKRNFDLLKKQLPNCRCEFIAQ